VSTFDLGTSGRGSTGGGDVAPDETAEADRCVLVLGNADTADGASGANAHNPLFRALYAPLFDDHGGEQVGSSRRLARGLR
jgi:hypothetical protein